MTALYILALPAALIVGTLAGLVRAPKQGRRLR